MARKPRIHFPGALYHIIARGNKGEFIFKEEGDYRRYLKFLREYKRRFPFFLYAYALMPTHVHLLVEAREVPLSKVMQTMQFRYTKNYNRKYHTWGHLFQGRYKAILCEKTPYLLELSAYIHLNPVRAGLVERPSEYKWSSFNSYLHRRNDDLVDHDFLLSHFSETRRTAAVEYKRFVSARIDQGHNQEFYRLQDQRFLGSDEYVEDIHRGLKKNPAFAYHLEVPEIINGVAAALNVSSESIMSKNRNRQGAFGRFIVGHLARKLGRTANKEIADYFGRDPAVISKGLRVLEEKMEKDKELAKRILAVEEALTKGKKKAIVN
jgi:putative transposase